MVYMKVCARHMGLDIKLTDIGKVMPVKTRQSALHGHLYQSYIMSTNISIVK